MTEPKGLHIPCLEDIERVVELAGIVVKYIDVGLEDNDEFPISVCDEILIHDGRLVDVYSSEGICFYPSVNRWTLEAIFGTILSSLFYDEKVIAISRNNLTAIAEQMKLMVNFIWGLGDKLPAANDFRLKHDNIMDMSISISEKVS